MSDRVNPQINCLKYPETTKKFENQVINVLVPHLELFSRNVYLGNNFATEVIKRFNESTGYSISFINQECTVNDILSLLPRLSNEDFLDFLDIYIQVMYYDDFISYMDSWNYNYYGLIDDLNTMMKINGVDLKIEDGHCIRISEPTIQEEIITPAFVELNKKGFKNAQSYLWKSFDFFKKGNNEGAILHANMALEATIGYIIEKKGLDDPKKDKMSSKLGCLVRSGVLPEKYESSFNALIALLQASSVIRNKYGSHGSTDENPVADLYVQYAIDSAASAILFLVRLYH